MTLTRRSKICARWCLAKFIMNPTHILITGGCGFVGSSLALRLRQMYPQARLTVIDNLVRKGSELNVPRLASAGIEFIQGNVQDTAPFAGLTDVDLIIDCAAEPSVLAGLDGSPLPVIETNLWGTVNVLELARRTGAGIIFLSTSRVYPVQELNRIATIETDTRFTIAPDQLIPGVSLKGINEDFPMGIERTLYGATKLASELLLHEYASLYGVRSIINRCGVIAGPWQFGKADQGVAVLWMARHVFGGTLSYIGYGGQGKQVRDFLHIDDLWDAVAYELSHWEALAGETFTIGGGLSNAASLCELTALCETMSGQTIAIGHQPENRFGDVKIYVSDNSRFEERTGWKPTRSVPTLMQDIYTWMTENRRELEPLFSTP